MAAKARPPKPAAWKPEPITGPVPTRERAGYGDGFTQRDEADTKRRGDDRELVRGHGTDSDSRYLENRQPSSTSPLVSRNDQALGDMARVPEYDPENRPTGHDIFRRQ